MTRQARFRTVALAGVITAGLAAGAIGAAYADDSSPVRVISGGDTSGQGPAGTPGTESPPLYQPPAVNTHGQTYGSALGAMSIDQVPDLVQVYDNEGQTGYARKADVFPTTLPKSPEEALAIRPTPRTVPVYASDGITVIGTYTVNG